MPKLGSFNLHAALLPQYRGAAPINWALINGERMTGVTTFMLDKDIDTGGIILRQEYRISPEDTAGTLHDKLMEIGAKLVVETTEGIFQKNVETRVQRSFIQGSEVLRSAPKLSKENTRINWSASADDIYNFVRGLSPYPAAWTTLTAEGKEPMECKIFFGKALSSKEIVAGGGFAAPGTIASDGKTYLAVATGNGWFMVSDLQLAGKKRMAVEDFLRGWRNPESYKAD
jgi:methionyl-tRNA formyltransferase